jgi:hypothetical protein
VIDQTARGACLLHFSVLPPGRLIYKDNVVYLDWQHVVGLFMLAIPIAASQGRLCSRRFFASRGNGALGKRDLRHDFLMDTDKRVVPRFICGHPWSSVADVFKSAWASHRSLSRS